MEYFKIAFKNLNLGDNFTLVHMPSDVNPLQDLYQIFEKSRLVCIWDNSGCKMSVEDFVPVQKMISDTIHDMRIRDGLQTTDFNADSFKGKELMKETTKQPTETNNFRNGSSSEYVFRLKFADLTDYELAFMISHASAEQMRRIQNKKMETHLKHLESHLPEELKHYSTQSRSSTGMLQLPISGDKPIFKHAIPMPDQEGESKPRYDLPIPMDDDSEDK